MSAFERLIILSQKVNLSSPNLKKTSTWSITEKISSEVRVHHLS
jgi:hypothetical protein